jgi:hypothetical protein
MMRLFFTFSTIGKGQKKDVTGSAKQVGVAIDAGNYSDYASPAE